MIVASELEAHRLKVRNQCSILILEIYGNGFIEERNGLFYLNTLIEGRGETETPIGKTLIEARDSLLRRKDE